MQFSGRQAFFRIIRNTKSLEGARRLVHYIAFRSRQLPHERKGGFDRERDEADVDHFCDKLDHRLTRHRAVPVAFHTIFSLPKEEAEKAGLTDWKTFVRDVVGQYEASRQIRLDWFAAMHDSETSPHCHVVFKAAYTNEDGREVRLRFNKQDLREIRQLAGRKLAEMRYRHQAPERAARAFLREQATIQADRLAKIQTGLDMLRDLIRKHREERRREEEAHERWLWDE